MDRPHGLHGQVVVTLATDRAERVASGSALTLTDGRVLQVQHSTPHKGTRRNQRFRVAFEGVTTPEQAERLRGAVLFAPPLDDPDALWVHDLVGARVDDLSGRSVGTVEAVQANPASDLLVLTDGKLIPLRFVVESVPGVSVLIDPPEGLLDLE